MQVERAAFDDLDAIERLLAASGLPVEGARDAFATGVVARERGDDPVPPFHGTRTV